MPPSPLKLALARHLRICEFLVVWSGLVGSGRIWSGLVGFGRLEVGGFPEPGTKKNHKLVGKDIKKILQGGPWKKWCLQVEAPH